MYGYFVPFLLFYLYCASDNCRRARRFNKLLTDAQCDSFCCFAPPSDGCALLLRADRPSRIDRLKPASERRINFIIELLLCACNGSAFLCRFIVRAGCDFNIDGKVFNFLGSFTAVLDFGFDFVPSMFSNLCDKIRVECQGVGEDVCVAALHGIILNGTDSEAYQSRFVNKSLFFI